MAQDLVSLDTATPQLEVPPTGETYRAPRAVAITPETLTGSTATPSLDISQTWNTTGTPTGLRLSVTDTASNAASNLLDLQVGGASKFKIDKSGNVSTHANQINLVSNTSTVAAIYAGTGGGGNPIDIGGFGTVATVPFRVAYTGITIANRVSVGFTSGSNINSGNDLVVLRDAAGTLAQRNGTNAQAFRLYGTYTAADNFQRVNVAVAKVASGALSGASVTLTGAIPAGAVVVGVTSRVTTLLTGATGYQIGTSTDADRFGDITGTAVGTVSKNTDWTAGTIECFPAATDVVLTAKTSDFTAGAIEVCISYMQGDAD